MEDSLEMEEHLLTCYNILNTLSDNENEYFFFFDILNERLYLPKRFKKDFPIVQSGEHCYTLKDWYSIIYPKDLPILAGNLQLLRSGKQTALNVDYRIIDRLGNILWANCRGSVQTGDKAPPRWLAGRISDAPSRSRADHLTGAFNLDMLKEEIQYILAAGWNGYLFLVDVDDQKSINLKHGQAFGDTVLKRVAEALDTVTSEEQRIYRTNGDCFAVNLPGATTSDVTQMFQQLQTMLDDSCTLSAGCVPYQTYKVSDAGTMYQYAENSVDYAKAHGKNTLWFFSAEDYEKDLAVLELKEELQNSIKDHFSGFFLCYQPQVYSHSYTLHGAEALIRYRSPRRGLVMPDEFISILESSGMICAVGAWVLDTALLQCAKWRERQADFCISVNMSYVQLCEEDIAERVLRSLERSGLPGSALTIEITESLELLNYPHLNDIFRRWNEYGITISIDDFGTGYSSLSRLKEMEVDEIKIDRCFVNHIQDSAYNYRLLSNMLELADSSQIRVCCEGVETMEELRVLEALRPQLLQGFLFSKPQEAADFEALYFDPASPRYQKREEYCRQMTTSTVESCSSPPAFVWNDQEIGPAILNGYGDIFSICDPETHELYYLNPAGQALFHAKDYHGKKCYKVLQGKDSPCEFCSNSQLKSDQFHISERFNNLCGRRFLMKGKLISFKGKPVRLEIALDTTDHEIRSPRMLDPHKFPNTAVEYARVLSEVSDNKTAIQQSLSIVGAYYQADRAYLFEPDPIQPQHWNNTYEWCRPNVVPQMDNLQHVPPSVLERWIERFQRNESVIIYNIDTIQDTNPAEWAVMTAQDITRLIAVPVYREKKLVAFLGIDNPRYAIYDDSQARLLCHFLTARIQPSEERLHLSQNPRPDFSDILTATGVGLWIIRIDEQARHYELLADANMYCVLAAPRSLSPEECYKFWYSRINEGYYHYVNESMDRMIHSGRVVQMQYTWKHPVLGEVLVQCTGIRGPDENGMTCLSGYYRIISDVERPRSFPVGRERDVFEYNEFTHSIFFHTNRALIAGDAEHEANFPRCWIENRIVHPHFVFKFESTFSCVCEKKDFILPEILLKSKQGSYKWFRLMLRHLGSEQKDCHTVAVLLEPIGQERVRELEAIRTKRFYQALLSETVAHAEVDLESGQLKSVGGLWQHYRESVTDSTHFIDMLSEQLAQYLPPDEMALFRNVCNPADWSSHLNDSEPSRRFCCRYPINGVLHWMELVVHVFQEDTTENIYAIIYLKDINAEKEQALAQAKAANRDPLTGIYNRAAFERKVCAHVQSASDSPCGILMLLDIDDFKTINDHLGHLSGDNALKEISHILLTTFRSNDIVGRLGGDEFLVFLTQPMSKDALSHRLEQLLDHLSVQSAIPLTISIGVTYVHPEGFDYTRSLDEADTALYRSKRTGKNKFLFYEDISSNCPPQDLSCPWSHTFDTC